MSNTTEATVQASAEEVKVVKKTTGKKKNVYQKLMSIQTVLKAPKNLYNKFGKYNYRNAEGILEAVKPYLAEQECVLILEDQIETIGSEIKTRTAEDGSVMSVESPRRYIKAIAKLIDCDTGESISTSAYANECEHTGMSGDQCTGTASSYARKYCLNALFLLDDTKDSDTDEMKNIENAATQNSGQSAQKTQSSGQSGGWNRPASTTANRSWGQK